MGTQEKYLKPEVIRQVARLDLKARFIIEGFFAGLHASPFHGFSVEFSEHRKYAPGDDLKDIDWTVYAKTDKFYVKKFEAETNLTGYLVVDVSGSMGYSYSGQITKQDYAICLAAALGYLMIHQQDSVGLVTFSDRIRSSLPPRSKRSHLANMLAVLANTKSHGESFVGHTLQRLATMIRHRSLVMVFSDLLTDPEPVFSELHRLRYRGNDIILFHILDEAELEFPFRGPTRFVDIETPANLVVDPEGVRAGYKQALSEFCGAYQKECTTIGIDYVGINTSVAFDKALMSYLVSRKSRF
jgi:uncharacterized protein (DUF58 family)